MARELDSLVIGFEELIDRAKDLETIRVIHNNLRDLMSYALDRTEEIEEDPADGD